VLLATGLRTNEEGARQVAAALADLDVTVVRTRLPGGTMHLMGQLRFPDRDLAVAWTRRLDPSTVDILADRGIRVLALPSEEEAVAGMALNMVTLGPRSVIMPAGNHATQGLLEDAGVSCLAVDVGEIAKAAGAIGCMTGVLHREVP
jgi:N-dimethylarginine dimethylaminohydrolase